MTQLSNSPRSQTVITLEARKSFALGLVFKTLDSDDQRQIIDLTGATVKFTMAEPDYRGGTLLLTKNAELVWADHGYARLDLQADELNLTGGEYPFAITLIGANSYSGVVVKGVVNMLTNPDSTLTPDFTGVNPNQSLQVALGQQNKIEIRANAVSANDLTIGSVVTLAAGEPAAADISGAYPAQQLNLSLPAGAKGDKGDKGARGDDGDSIVGPPGADSTVPGPPGADSTVPGPANVLTVGTVTSVGPNADPVVTITGTSPNQVLNLALKQGATGAPGAASTVPGPPGADSTVPGPPGADSTVPGPPGADSTVPGPPGYTEDELADSARLHANGPLGAAATGQTPTLVGYTSTAPDPAANPVIQGGRLVSTATGATPLGSFAMYDLEAPVLYQRASWVINPTGTAGTGTMGIISWGPGFTGNPAALTESNCHLSIFPGGWEYSIVYLGMYYVMQNGTFTVPLVADGSTVHTCEVVHDILSGTSEVIYLYLPDNSIVKLNALGALTPTATTAAFEIYKNSSGERAVEILDWYADSRKSRALQARMDFAAASGGGGGVALGETSTTAYRGDHGKIAYDHSQVVAGNPHGTTKTDIGLANVTNAAQLPLAGGTMVDAANIAVGTTTGTKIGTATTQKLGFFNATPVAQPAQGSDLSTVLSSLGLRAAGTTYATRVGSSLRTGAVGLLTTSSHTNLCDATSASFTVTLPSTSTAGYEFTFIRVDSVVANLVTVDAGASNTINGVQTFTLPTVGDSVTVTSTSTTGVWRIKNQSTTTPIFNSTVQTSSATLTRASASAQTIDATSASVILTLPATTTAGLRFNVRRRDNSANTATLTAGTSINGGAASLTLAQWQSVTVESTTTSGAWIITTDNRFPSAPSAPAFKTATWHQLTGKGSLFGGGNTIITPTPSTLYFYPILLPKAVTIQGLSAWLNALGATGSTWRLGIYNDDGFGAPSTLLADYGTVATTGTTGIRTWTISQALQATTYWLAFIAHSTGSPGTVRGFDTGVTADSGVVPDISIGTPVFSGPLTLGLSQASVAAGALPGTATTSAGVVSGPKLYMQVA